MWSDLPLEVKLKIFESLLADEGQGYAEVCREWRDLQWQERSHLDLSLRATLHDVSNEEASLRRVLARCRRLATLILSHCPVSDDVLSAFDPFGPTLRVLILSSCPQLSNDGLARLAATGALARLERLELGGCVRVTGQGVAHVVSLCPRLRSLNVSGVWGFGDAHVKAVVGSARELTRIDVGGTAISNVGLRHLLESECAARLEFVGLAHCSHLTADSSQGGLVDLSTHCPSLIELDLSGLTQLQDRTLWLILERCCKLEALNVAKCESLVSSRTVARMQQSPCLRTVYISRYQALYPFMKRHSFAVPLD